jgi:hypothetical protein
MRENVKKYSMAKNKLFKKQDMIIIYLSITSIAALLPVKLSFSLAS